MSPLIEVISDEESRKRLDPRDILPDVVISPPNQEDLLEQCISHKTMNSQQIQMLLYKLVVYFRNAVNRISLYFILL